MKKIRMIVSAVAVLAVVGSALAFKTKIRPTLYTCENGTCIITADKNDEARGTKLAENPGNLFKPNGGTDCGSATPNCTLYTGDVYQSN